jgi:hypothetical protein
VAVDAVHIWWTNLLADRIGRANLNGTGVDEAFLSGAASPTGIADDGAHVYWANFATNAIGRADVDGSDINQRFITGAFHPEGVAVEASTTAPPPPPTIADLVADVTQAGLPRGIERSLLAKLGAAQRKLDGGHHQGACGSLGASINQVEAQSGKQLAAASAEDLVAEAAAVRDALGCGTS